MTRPSGYRRPENWRDQTQVFTRALYVCVALLVVSCVWQSVLARRHPTVGWAMPLEPPPPELPAEQSDIAALTGGKRHTYPRPTTAAPEFPQTGPFADARQYAYARAWGSGYLALKGKVGNDPGGVEGYAFALSAFYSGRYADAYPTARKLAEIGFGGWSGNLSPREIANAIEDLSRVLPHCYTIRDHTGRVLYRLYFGDDASMARRMAPAGVAAFSAARKAVPGSSAVQAAVAPIPVYSLPSYAEWVRFCKARGTASVTGAWGVAQELSIVGRDESKHGRTLCGSNAQAADFLAHETAHVLTRASGSRWRRCWLIEGVGEAAVGDLDPFERWFSLGMAEDFVTHDARIIERAIATDRPTEVRYDLFYALEEYTRYTYGEQRLGALLTDPDADNPRLIESVYRRHLGVGSREICEGATKWLTSRAWESDTRQRSQPIQRAP